MAAFTITLSDLATQRLRLIASKAKLKPEEVLQRQAEGWLAEEIEVALEPGESLPPVGMFPDDGCVYTFFDPSDADPSRPEDWLTPEQRETAVAEILATIALRILKEDQEKKAAGGSEAETSEQPAQPSKTSKKRTSTVRTKRHPK